MKKHIPNAVTLLNAFFGMVGINYVFAGDFSMAFYMMLLAAVADFLDGFVARMLHVKSELGAELDSLSDMVTFGALPGFIMFKMIGGVQEYDFLKYTGFLITIFAGYRLAKFNISSDQDVNFKGLPTPMNALFISSLTFIDWSKFAWLNQQWVLIVITLSSCVLMVSNVPLIGMKFNNFSVKENLARFILILASIILVFTLNIAAIPVILLIYILLSILHLKLKLL